MDDKLIALAEALDAARLSANAMEVTAPQAGVYGQIETALRSTLSLIDSANADEIFESIIRDGNNVRDAIDYATRTAADLAAYAAQQEELQEIETELSRKYSGFVYNVVPAHREGQIWDMITYAAGTNQRTPNADFAVRAFKTSYGISTSSI